MKNVSSEVSPEGQDILDAARKAVADAFERKRKLGQYAVVWDGEKPVRRYFDQEKPESSSVES
jgi:hypothetical protein